MTGDHFHTESLEAFEHDLATVGFEPVTIAGLAAWRGPIRQAFSGLTDATTMNVVIRPGWPFQSPALLADGLDTNHSTREGFVCLWQDGDPSRDWITCQGFFARVDEWCENAKRSWEDDELQGDAFLNFRIKSGFPFPYVATVDLSKLNVRNGSWGEFRGTVNANPRVLISTAGARIRGTRCGAYGFMRENWTPLHRAGLRKCSGTCRGARKRA